uniref:Odorant binding protein n=1 Tax=Dendrolimus kikuchii TaxID=765133 RepID=A0A076E941_9NEOP|nr:odorant binding protein [Dendrolimus kikuchii]
MFRPVFIYFTFIYFLFCDVQAQMNLDELQKAYLNYVLECAVENSVTPDDLEELKNLKMPDKENVRCLFACAYKKAGMMNDKGELFIEGVQEITKKYFSDNPEKMKYSEQFIQACESVNDAPVSDSKKGCDRAALIFKCGVENVPDFEFIV